MRVRPGVTSVSWVKFRADIWISSIDKCDEGIWTTGISYRARGQVEALSRLIDVFRKTIRSRPALIPSGQCKCRPLCHPSVLQTLNLLIVPPEFSPRMSLPRQYSILGGSRSGVPSGESVLLRIAQSERILDLSMHKVAV